MKVKLLHNVVEGGQKQEMVEDPKGKKIPHAPHKINTRKDGREIEFVKGNVIEMSEASAKKYIKRGLAVAVKEKKGRR